MGKITQNYQLEKPAKKSQKYICKECSRETSHKIIASYLEKGSEEVGGGNSVDWNVRNQIIQCLGCESVSFRTASTCSEDYDYDNEGNCYCNETVTFYPGRAEGLKAINTYLLPPTVQNIYKETILALENEQYVLAGIGIRALIETVCKDLKAEGKDLHSKLNDLKEKSIVTKEGLDTLHKLRVLGNKAAHEVKSHNKQQLSLAITIIEHILEGTYIIPQQVSSVFK